MVQFSFTKPARICVIEIRMVIAQYKIVYFDEHGNNLYHVGIMKNVTRTKI